MNRFCLFMFLVVAVSGCAASDAPVDAEYENIDGFVSDLSSDMPDSEISYKLLDDDYLERNKEQIEMMCGEGEWKGMYLVEIKNDVYRGALFVDMNSYEVACNISKFVKAEIERSETFQRRIDCAYGNIEADPNYSSFDEVTGIFRTFVKNTGVSDVRLTGVIVWIDDVEQVEIVFDASDDRYFVEKDKYKEFEFDLTDVFKGSGGELTKIKVMTECPVVFDTLSVPRDGWKSEES